MCIKGNNANHAAKFVNDQLHSLYNIADHCVTHYTKEKMDRALEPGYDFALREFYYKSEKSPLVKFEFLAPRIEFVCDHDAILHLAIESVTVHSIPNLADIVKYSDAHKAVTKGRQPEPKNLSLLEGTVSVRVPFSKYKVLGKSEAFGNGKHDINHFILDLSRGNFVQPGLKVAEAHLPYLEAYLKHLTKAGHHVLYSLPDFDDDGLERKIEFSAAAGATYDHFTKVSGIELELVSKHVERVWLEAAWLAHEQKFEGKDEIDFPLRNIAVAKWERKWRKNLPFDIEFGAPTVRLLCEREAILTFSLENIVYYAGDKEKDKRSYSDWKISVIVDIIHEVQSNGAVSIIKINTEKDVKFVESLSFFGDCEFDNETDVLFYSFLIKFILREYIISLQDGEFYLFYQDSRKLRLSGTDRWIGKVEDPDHASQITASTDMCGFEQIIALSHSSLDNILHEYHLENKGSWMQLFQKDDFELRFGPSQLRLLSRERALVFFHLKSGKLRTGPTSGVHHLENWKLAFEVKLDMRDVDLKDCGEFQRTQAYNAAKDWKQTQVRQLYINFKDAKFNYVLSTFNDKNFGNNHLTIAKVSATTKLILEHVLKEVRVTHADVLYSVVVSKDVSATRPRYAFFDVKFQTYAKFEVNNQNYNTLVAGEEPVIVILGTTNPKTQLPVWDLRYSSHWIRRPVYSRGTLALSSDVFLKGRLLPLLANINRATTIVPDRLDMDRGRWSVKVMKWAEKWRDEDHPTDWDPIHNTNSPTFEYKWDWSDRYEYSHDGAPNDGASGTYHLALKTNNRLIIPTSFRDGQLDITIKGTTSVTRGWSSGNDDNSGERKAEVSWGIVISAVTDANGLSVTVTKPFKPREESTQEGYTAPEDSFRVGDPLEILKSGFPSKIPLGEELKSLKTFENAWYSIFPGIKKYKLVNPFFTRKGDLLLELWDNDKNTVPSVTNLVQQPGDPIIPRPTPSKSRVASRAYVNNGSGSPTPDKRTLPAIAPAPAPPVANGKPTTVAKVAAIEANPQGPVPDLFSVSGKTVV